MRDGGAEECFENKFLKNMKSSRPIGQISQHGLAQLLGGFRLSIFPLRHLQRIQGAAPV